MSNILPFTAMPKKTDLALLPNRLRYWREARGHTLRTLAPLAGITFGALARMETGSMELSFYWMEKLGAILDVPPADLLLPKDGALTGEEREIIDTYRRGTDADRHTLRGVAESQRAFRGQATIHPLTPPQKKAG